MSDRQWTVSDLSAIDDFLVDVCKRAEETIKKTNQVSGAHYNAMLVEYRLIEKYVREHKRQFYPPRSDDGQRLEIV